MGNKHIVANISAVCCCALTVKEKVCLYCCCYRFLSSISAVNSDTSCVWVRWVRC